MPRNQIGVVGYGNIGNKIVHLLLRENIQPVVVIRNPDKGMKNNWRGDNPAATQIE
jgi:predicted dinucleotide-utilizing enzyme